MPNTAPGADIARIRVSAAPGRAERIRDYLNEIGDPNHFFCGPIEVQTRFNPHGSPLRPLIERHIQDF
ncbi:MAG: hypothetical protein IKS52_01060 [Clostridia bacterium]|nr:hypothetical protein [Clostridia bacterium]MBO4883695.1 hypothetical protein [Clostridia bacterium]MBR4441844.1 hypothetical protein [Clostridia bacterium]